MIDGVIIRSLMGFFGYLGPSKEYRVPNNDKAIVIEMDKALLLT